MFPHVFASLYTARDAGVFRRNATFLPLYSLMLLFVFFAGFSAVLQVPGLKGPDVDLSLANVETISTSVPGKAGSAAVIAAATADMRPFNIIPQQADWDTDFAAEYTEPLYLKEDTAENLAPDARAVLESWLP